MEIRLFIPNLWRAACRRFKAGPLWRQPQRNRNGTGEPHQVGEFEFSPKQPDKGRYLPPRMPCMA